CLGITWSVSTLTRSSGATTPACVVKACIVRLLRQLDAQRADVHEMAGDSGSRRHNRTDQVRAAAFALTAFKIAIGSAGAAFPRKQKIVVHSQTHTAAGFPPFESSLTENFVQPFLFGLFTDYL